MMLGWLRRNRVSSAAPRVTLEEMAAQQRMQYKDNGPDGTITVWDGETAFTLRNENRWTVSSTDRGVNHPLGTFSDRDAALKFFVMIVGRYWRSEKRYPQWSGREVAVLPGTQVRRLEWTGGWAELPHGYSGGLHSGEYRLLVTASLDDVLASFGHPHGRPLFRV